MARTKLVIESGKMPSKKALARQARESLQQSIITNTDVADTDDHRRPRHRDDDDHDDDDERDDTVQQQQQQQRDPSKDVTNMIVAMEDRRHNRVAAREKLVEAFLFDLQHRCYVGAGMEPSEGAASLSQKLLRFACRADTTRERVLSLQAFAATVLVWPTVPFLDDASAKLKDLVTDDEDEGVKRHAIFALAAIFSNPEASDHDMSGILEYFTEIVQSDGTSVDAPDSSGVVTAAAQSWAFVAAHMDSFEESISPALEAFLGQLDSSSPDVQSMASRCIAFIFEESRFRETATGTSYRLPVSEDDILSRLTATLASNRRHIELRRMLGYVITSIERHVGPYYSTAEHVPQHAQSRKAKRTAKFVTATPVTSEGTAEEHGSRQYGLRKSVRISNTKVCTVNTWELDFKLEMLHDVLGAGYIYHIAHNNMVSDRLERVDGLDEDEFPRMRTA
jgi:hypothetical protein